MGHIGCAEYFFLVFSYCENKSNPEGQGYVLLAPSEETCPGSREGIATHAVVAVCARDMSVGAVISEADSAYVEVL